MYKTSTPRTIGTGSAHACNLTIHFRNLFMLLALFFSSMVSAQVPNWGFEKGYLNAPNSASYGTQGIADPANTSGTRVNAVTWSLGDKLYLFGGQGQGDSGNGRMNDLWEYNTLTGQWRWLKGSKVSGNTVGNYGTLGVESPSNNPGARTLATGWVANGKLYLYGGTGTSGTTATGNLNDLWRYDPATNNWTWIKGANSINSFGVYGTRGTAAAGNVPGARAGGSASAVGNKLYLFGGTGYTANQNGYLNDLWSYDVTSGQWTWVSGSNTPNISGVYGTQGQASSTTAPPAKYYHVSWSSGANLYVFGGYSYLSGGVYNSNDLWEYNTTTGQWRWLKGSSNTTQAYGIYGIKGVGAAANTPGSRMGARAAIHDGKLYLLGGNGTGVSASGILNDLWQYDITTNQWLWLDGSNAPLQLSVYGTQGVADPLNTLGGRVYGAMWSANGKLYHQGGQGYGLTNSNAVQNDFWEYDLQSTDWRWLTGGNRTYSVGIYGTKGVAAAANMPGPRQGHVIWELGSKLYLFGGLGYANGVVNGNGYLNDLWEYDTQTKLWTWIKGADVQNQFANYGSLGVASPTSTPGGRTDATGWVYNNKLYFFGGTGYAASTSGSNGDLWEFDPATGNWRWLKHNVVNANGVYGTQGVAAATNRPGTRQGAVSWVDGDKAYLFGGLGYASANGYLADIWEYDMLTGNWKFVKGPTAASQVGVYGTKGIANTSNRPGGKANAVQWQVGRKIYIFGGQGNTTSTGAGYTNDLWEYDMDTNNWTWLEGTNVLNQIGVYGSKGVPAPANNPGARFNASRLTLGSKLFLMGGQGYGSVAGLGSLNDVWEYDLNTGDWNWIKGTNLVNQQGKFDPNGAASANIIGGRNNSAATISGDKGYMFGGIGFGTRGINELRGDLWAVNFTDKPLPVISNFPDTLSATYGDADIILAAQSTNTLTPIVYTSEDESIASIVNGKIRINGAGTVTLSATQPESNAFTAQSADQVFTVRKANQALVFNALPSKFLGEAPFKLRAVGGGAETPVVYTSSNPSIVSISDSTATIHAVGTVNITASQAGDDNYNVSPNIIRSLQIKPTPLAKVLVNYTAPATSLNTTFGAPSSAASLSVSGTDLTTGIEVSAAGGYQVSLNQTSYSSSVSIPGTGTIASTTVYYRIDSVAAAGNPLGVITVMSEGAIPVTQELAEATVEPAALTVTLSDQTKVYGTAQYGVQTANFTHTALKNGNQLTAVTLNFMEGSNSDAPAGYYAESVSGSFPSGTNGFNADNYIITYVPAKLTVTPAPLSVKATSLNKLFGAADPELTYTITQGNLYGSDQFTGALTRTAGENVGVYPITQGTLSAGPNYTLTFSPSPFTIGQSVPVITFPSVPTLVYGQSPQPLTATSPSGAAFTYMSSNPNVAVITDGQIQIVGAGTTTITISQTSSDSYGAPASVEQTITVNPAPATLALSGLTHINDGTAKTATVTSNPEGLTGITVTYNGSETAPSATGTYTVLAKLVNPNYTAPDVTGELVIGKAAQAITFESLAAQTFGDANFPLIATGGASNNAITYTSSNSEVAVVTDGVVQVTGAGTTTITASQAGNDQYLAADDVQQVLTVNPAALVVVANNVSKTYGEQLNTQTVSSGFFAQGLKNGNQINSVVLSYTSGADVTSAAGTYPNSVTPGQISGSSGFVAGNYQIEYLAAALTVNPRELVIQPVSANKIFGEADPQLTYSYTGTLVGTDAFSYALGREIGEDAGIYAIQQGTLLAGPNYNLTFTGGASFTILPATPLITLSAAQTLVYGQPDQPINALSTSQTPFTYESSNPAVATIVDGKIHIEGAGTTTLKISQAATQNYVAVDAEQLVTVQKAPGSIALLAAQVVYNGSPRSLELLSNPSNLSGITVTYNGSVTPPTHVGTYQVSALSTNPNYEVAPAAATLQIAEAPQTILVTDPGAKTFGDADFALTATGGGSGNAITFVSSNINVASVEGNLVKINGAGTATITASQAGNSNYLPAPNVQTVVTVDPAAADLALSSINYTYDGNAKTAVATTTPAGLTGVIFLYNGGSSEPVNAGEYEVTATLNNPNYQQVSKTATLSISKAEQAITFNTLGAKTYGDAEFALTATGGPGENPVTYTSSNPNVATVNNGIVQIIGAGSAVITASQQAGTNYLAAADVSQTLTVNQAAVVITLSSLQHVFDGTVKSALATTSPEGLSGVTVSYNGSASAPAQAGTYAVVAKLENTNYAASDVSGNLVIEKAEQAINFAPLVAKTFGDTDFTVSATGGQSGNTITFSSSNPAVATVTDNTITIIGAGSTTITAAQDGNANYMAATAVNQQLTINRATATLNLANLAHVYDGASKTAQVHTSPSGLTGLTVTYNGNTDAPVNAGSYAVVAQLDNLNYEPVQATGSLVIDKAAQAISFAPLAAKTFGDADFTITANGGQSGNAVTFTSSNDAVATVSNGIVHIAHAGTATITASQAGNENYHAAADVSYALVVNQASATVALSGLDHVYDGSGKAAVATTTPAEITGLSVTYDGLSTLPAQAGVYSVIAKLENPDYQLTQAAGNLVISKAEQNISFSPIAPKTFGDADFSLNAAGGQSGNPVTYISSNPAVATVSNGLVHITGAGTTHITAAQAGNSNYNNATSIVQELTVNQATAIISLSGLAYVYDGSAKTAIAATTPAGLTGLTITYNGSATPPSAAGNYTVVAQLENTNYQLVQSTGNLVISKANQAISFAPIGSKTFGDADFSLTATGGQSGNGIVYTSSNPAVATVNNGTVHIISAGTTQITASQAGNTNYNAAAAVSQELTVNRATATVSLANLTHVFNGSAKTVLATTTPAGLEGLTVTYNNTEVAPANAGTYAVLAKLVHPNYEVAEATGSLVISKAEQVISFAPLTAQTYGAANFALTAIGGQSGNGIVYTSSNPAVATVNNGTVQIVSAGTTQITASQAGNSNYMDAANVIQTLTVNRGNATIALSNLTHVFNGTAKSATAVTTPASLTGLTVTYNGSATLPSAAGTYSVVAQLANSNYNPAEVSGSLIISKASQTITFAPLTARTFGDAAFNLSATGGLSANPVTFTSSNPGVATVTNGVVSILAAGTTTISASQADNNNYLTAESVSRVLTVNKAIAVIALSGASFPADGTAKTLAATTTPAGLTGLSYTYNGLLTVPTAPGVYTVVASLNHANYTATPVTATLTIASQTLKVQYRNTDGSPSNNGSSPRLRIMNSGQAAVPYSQLTMRYWITPENYTGAMGLFIDWAQLGTNKISMKYVSLAQPRVKALGYIEYSFNATSGNLNANGNSGDIQSRFANSDWTNFNELNDHSYMAANNYVEAPMITLYRNGTLIWGTEPVDETAALNLKVYAQAQNNGSNTISTYLDIRNEGNIPVDYKDLKVRYWFTPDGTSALKFAIDYAKIGNGAISSTFNSVSPLRQNASTYLELKVTPSNTNFYPLTSTGNIQYRINKSDWSNFTQTNDYSYVTGAMAANPKVTLYHKGILVYGTEPAVAGPVTMMANNAATIREASSTSSFGIPESQGLVLFPNPSAGKFALKMNDMRDGAFTVLIHTQAGKVIHSYSGVKNGDFRKDYELDLPKGMYYMVITWKDHKDYRTILIDK